jgi:predicted heme/steroid binding protein
MEKINKYGIGSNNKELVVTDKYGNVKSIFQKKLTLTTVGSSGPSTLVNNILNIPNYSAALSGYVPTSRQLTINGTTYDLSANRTWNVGTVTGVTATSPLSSSGGTTPNLTISQATSLSSGYLSDTDWNTFNNKQPAGSYITALSGEATGTGPGTAAVTLNNASVTAKVLTGVNITGGSISASDSILTAFGKIQNQINGLIGSSIYQGVWNASTNTPALASGVGTRGYYYIVNVAGSTNLDGITDWNVGDWAIFDGTAWQQVDNTDSVTSVNGQTGAVSLTSDNIPEGVSNLYFTQPRARQSISLTTSGSSGAATYNNTTGVLNIPVYTDQYIGTVTSVDMSVPTGFTISGNPITSAGTLALGFNSDYSLPTIASQIEWDSAYDNTIISASVTGTTTKTLTLNQQDGGTITASWTDYDTAPVTSVFGRTGAVVAQSGDYTTTLVPEGTNLYYTDARSRAAISLTTTGSSGASTYNSSTGILNIPNYSTALSGYVPTSRRLEINGISYDLSADRSWSVGTVTSIATSGPITGGTITGSGTIGINQASATDDGYLSSTDWNTFNNKQNAITLTTTGTSGPSTFSSNVLNVPDYSSAPRGKFAQTAKSVPVTNTTQAQSLIYVDFEESVLDDGGVVESLDCMEPELRNYGSEGSIIFPANTLKVGDSFSANLSGYLNCLASQVIGFRVGFNGLATTLSLSVITLGATTNRPFEISVNFTVRSIGESGVAKISTNLKFSYLKNGTNIFESSNFIYLNEDTFDTTIDNKFDITAAWFSANVSNSIYSDLFTLQKIY